MCLSRADVLLESLSIESRRTVRPACGRRSGHKSKTPVAVVATVTVVLVCVVCDGEAVGARVVGAAVGGGGDGSHARRREDGRVFAVPSGVP